MHIPPLMAAAAGVGGGFVSVATEFALTQFLSIADGGTDSDSITISAWYNRKAAATEHIVLGGAGAGNSNCYLLSDNGGTHAQDYQISDSTAANRVRWAIPASTDDAWHSIILSVQLNAPFASRQAQLFIDGVDAGAPTNNTGSGAQVPWSGAWQINASALGAGRQACLAFIWMDSALFDLSDPDILALFRNPVTGGPADLGTNGQIPTGSPPRVYLYGAGDELADNHGNLGAFTVNNGPLAACTNAP